MVLRYEFFCMGNDNKARGLVLGDGFFQKLRSDIGFAATWRYCNKGVAFAGSKITSYGINRAALVMAEFQSISPISLCR